MRSPSRATVRGHHLRNHAILSWRVLLLRELLQSAGALRDKRCSNTTELADVRIGNHTWGCPIIPILVVDTNCVHRNDLTESTQRAWYNAGHLVLSLPCWDWDLCSRPVPSGSCIVNDTILRSFCCGCRTVFCMHTSQQRV